MFSEGLLFVACPLRGKIQVALVKKILAKLDPVPKFELKVVSYFIKFPHCKPWVAFLNEVANLFVSDKNMLLRRLLPFLLASSAKDFLPSGLNLISGPPALKETVLGDKQAVLNYERLSTEQLLVAREVCALINTQRFAPALLHGVTSSGKSQIYLAFIASLLKQGRSAIFLVPEISLAKNFLQFFTRELAFLVEPELLQIFAWHATEVANKDLLWQAVARGMACLIVGVHQPVFLPLKNLGGIVVDEEHEASFTEQQPPHLDTKLLALLLAQRHNIPIILGSATPSVSSFFQAKEGVWRYFTLKERFSATSASVALVPLNYDKKPFWLTQPLKEKLKQKLTKNEQSILYLNRRGFAPTTKCSTCKQSFSCTNCSVSLVLHVSLAEGCDKTLPFLECHYCGLLVSSPFTCSCASSGTYHRGLGTEQVCQVLQKEFPVARILRADKLSVGKKDWGSKISLFAAGSYDILVGTKTVTKGYHFPGVTLAVVLWADLDFSFPDYRATERALQQTLQVAGRSGRGEKVGEVIIQAFDTEPLQAFLTEDNYEAFLRQELLLRKQLNYPPYSKLLFVQMGDVSEQVVLEKITILADKLQGFCSRNLIKATFLGPATPLVFKKNKLFLQQVMVKIGDNQALRKILSFLKTEKKSLACTYWIEV
jgi:primosomal protein N' (replication factor Y)